MISFKQVSKSFASQEILRDVSFYIGSGERVGIVGPNGTGKSTVFNLICHDISPDKGTIDVQQSARVAHLRQEFNPRDVSDSVLGYAESGRPDLLAMHKEIEALEHDLHEQQATLDTPKALARLGELQTQFERDGGYEMAARAKAALCGLGFAADALQRPFSEFSGGWQMRAELARVLVAVPDILLLDEPTNYLDIPAIEWLRAYLKTFAGTMVLISHDRYLLNWLTTVTIEIANARATRFEGNYDFYVKDRDLRFEQQRAALKNQQREREQIERFVERFRAKNTKASQVQSRIKMLERMKPIDATPRALGPGRIRLKTPARSGQEVIRLDNAGATYDGVTWVLKRLDISIQRGERIAVVGLNGMGKTTLLRMLAGRLPPSEGKRVLGHKVVVGYQSQEFAETMALHDTVFATVQKTAGCATEQEVRSLLGGFGFSGSAVEKPVSVLSGGEKVRLAFARLLVNPPNFLVLDEPTTHLDIAARESLENALRAFEGTLCLVSHDIEFVRHVATNIFAMEPPGVRRYHGGYDDYREKMQAESAERGKANTPTETSKPDDRKARRRQRAQVVQRISRRKRDLLANIQENENRIETLEEERTELLATVSGGARNADYKTVQKRLHELQQELDRETRLWERHADDLERLQARVDNANSGSYAMQR